MTTVLDLDSELAALEERRRELREAQQQRIAELRGRLDAAEDRLRHLRQPPRPVDPHSLPEVQAAQKRFSDAHFAATIQYVPFEALSWTEMGTKGVREAKAAEAQRLKQEAEAAQDAYRSAVMEAGQKLHEQASEAEKEAAIKAADVRAEIAAIEAELTRLER